MRVMMNDNYKKTILLFEYSQFCESNSIPIDFDEYVMLKESSYRELEPKWKSWLAKGIGGVVALIGGRALAGHALTKKGWSKGGMAKNAVATTAGLLSVPIGIFLAKLYRNATDTCSNACGKDRVCYYKCYVGAADRAIAKIKTDIDQVSRLADNNEEENKMHKKLLTQLRFYQAKRDTFVKKLNHAANKRGEQRQTPDVDIYD